MPELLGAADAIKKYFIGLLQQLIGLVSLTKEGALQRRYPALYNLG
jgi:hypothetical protein